VTAEREPNPSPPAPSSAASADSELHRRLLGSPTMRLVGLAGQAMGNRYRRVLAEEDGLSPGAAGVLNALAWGQGRGLEAGTPGRATHSELAQRCMITPATLTGLVSTLEKAGYVRRRRDESDRRVVWLTLTEAGQARAEEIAVRARAANDELRRKLTPELEAALRDFLITVIENDLAVVHQETSVLTEHTPQPEEPGHRAPTARPAPPAPADQPAPGRTPC
jgi:DNA-binding MarR family transcriptional regulator